MYFSVQKRSLRLNLSHNRLYIVNTFQELVTSVPLLFFLPECSFLPPVHRISYLVLSIFYPSLCVCSMNV